MASPCEGGAGGGSGFGMTSAKKPGRNRSMRSWVASHSARCRSVRVMPSTGGTSISVAFMTKTTFLRDSGMASY